MIDNNLLVPPDRIREVTRRYHELLEQLERGTVLTVSLPYVAMKRFEKGLSNARQNRQQTIPKKYLSFVREMSASGDTVTLKIKLTARRKP